jgi:hypothetical protein
MSVRARNPLQPFASVVSALALLGITALPIGVAMMALTHDGSVWGIGETSICAQDDHITIGGPGDGEALAHLVRHGVAASNNGLSLCAGHPTTWQQTLNVLTQLPAGVFTLGLLILLWRLASGARRLGPFAHVNSRRLRLLGWWLIIGDLIAGNTRALAHMALLRSMTTSDHTPLWTDNVPALSWTMLIVGLGVITVARILTMATAMHEELAVTV